VCTGMLVCGFASGKAASSIQPAAYSQSRRRPLARRKEAAGVRPLYFVIYYGGLSAKRGMQILSIQHTPSITLRFAANQASVPSQRVQVAETRRTAHAITD
jgi:hypothetical protein